MLNVYLNADIYFTNNIDENYSPIFVWIVLITFLMDQIKNNIFPQNLFF